MKMKKKKGILVGLLCALSLAYTGFAFASCDLYGGILGGSESVSENDGEGESEHVHNWGGWKVTKKASCTGKGEWTRTCECDESETKEIPALGGEENYVEGICTKCGAIDPRYATEGLEFLLNDDGTEYSVTDYTGDSTTVIVAAIYNDLPVTRIGGGAFYNCRSLTSVKIPNSVTSIENWAFADCHALTSIELPGGVTSIGERAFYWCKSLTSIEIPSSVTSIGSEAFDCSGLTSIELPNGVTTIEHDAFYGCYNLTSIKLPGGVTSIKYRAFYGCSDLPSIEIPNSVTSIGYRAFYDCIFLTDITYRGTKEEWYKISKGEEWNSYTGTYTVHCTDGNIKKTDDH